MKLFMRGHVEPWHFRAGPKFDIDSRGRNEWQYNRNRAGASSRKKAGVLRGEGMKKQDIFRGWGRILRGHAPMLSIEITRECPLRCPGCYAYQPEHLGDRGPLRTLADYKGQDLIEGVLSLVRRHRPIHVSIVGGEPLVRFRELDVLLPKLDRMGIEVQLVTSAVRPIPESWSGIEMLHLVVSIDGLQPDHDVRRAPATYDRILQHIQGHSITVHCTVTRQMVTQNMRGARYFDEFLAFWSARPEVKKIWFSLFTPQMEEEASEILSAEDRALVLQEFVRLRPLFPKLHLPDVVIEGYRKPPKSPAECIFARTTHSVTADLQGRITPCQFGGNPDCSQCGCLASAGLKAIGDYQLFGILPVRSIYFASDRIGKSVAGILDRG
jgi:sulfatase maturation enzyme AslB (radical SAM superfamily)